MRSNFIIYSVLGWALIMFAACEDVIVVETDEAEERFVVDAWLDNSTDLQIIKLSTSQPYFDSSPVSPVIGATVNVINNTKGLRAFEDRGDGTYSWQPINGEVMGAIGDEFSLQIAWNGNEYLANTRMNRVPEIEEITQEDRQGELGPDGIYTSFFARDPLGIGDVYWIKTYKNGAFLGKPSEINIAFDASTDSGAEVDGVYFIPPIREITNPFEETEDGNDIISPWAVDDVIRIEIHSLSLVAFDFMQLARDQMLNGNNTIFATPIANTTGNIVNLTTQKEVLGIFNVAAISAAEKVIE